jgi:nitrogen fixation/metabolism regulation signal transduction histidine kinase
VLGLYEANAVPIILNLRAERTQVHADATRLRQVIHNLLQNAQDALQGSEHPQITLSTENYHGEIRLRVQDNGPGFSAQILARAFEPYMTTKQKGTGLGLAIVKKIVEEHLGHISIENATYGGAIIEIGLPLVVEM